MGPDQAKVIGNTEKLMDTNQMSTQELIDAMAPEPEIDERAAAAAEAREADTIQPDEVVDQPGEVEPVQDAVVDAVADAATAVAEEATPAADAVPADQAAAAAALTPHDRAIVKAARASETRAKKELAKLRRENEELRAKVPGTAVATTEKKPPAAVLEDVNQYAPEAGEYIQELERQVEAMKKAVPKQADPEPEFEPDVLHEDPDVAAEIQADLDEVPEVSSWHVDPDQTNWRRAVAIETMLAGSPAWKDRPLTERLQETVRLRKEELKVAAGRARDVTGGADPSATPPKTATKPTAEDARRVIEAKAKAAPVSASDIRGRSPPTRIASKRETWHTMTNEQLLAGLPEIPE